MLSFWEKEHFQSFDIAIVGAGITGLSTAIELKTKLSSLRIVVLERGLIPTGASTKNAGFACVGSLTEIIEDLSIMPQQEVVDLVKLRKEGLEILRNRLGDDAIGYEDHGSFELCLQDRSYTDDLQRVNRLLFPVFDQSIFKVSDRKFSFSSDVKTVIESSAEGQINTGLMMASLLDLTRKLGIEVKTGYFVEELVQEAGKVKIVNKQFTLNANQVCICSNAFTKTLLPSLGLKPGRGQVLITKPIHDLPFKGVFHFSEGYYYFRNVGNRVLFGGGRQLDTKTEETTEFEFNELILKDLESKLTSIVLPDTAFEIERRWTGIMAFGASKKPIIRQIDKRIFAAVRFGGMGVAIGSKAGAIIAQLMLENQDL